ncbi:[protein-PII] uridylyltransferase [Halorhodospira halophila]|uniref:Bifunctional uridylyltransferase/uridylyl-removing enzyme n=1 Tax=Halorhodospira halophila (strain DSM 244 / SL1) TaxID=349124 RepID=A1WX23_HALHL|nr:[protein-PII] uridylyltransferase [Halorhodospira halophila]ABM62235.1 metal dependent phosphohydrolase [Halorhodospira halophila SL1]MBK1729210.1 [protein-PII] uridylyltransferase [Halorhodospira halophila]
MPVTACPALEPDALVRALEAGEPLVPTLRRALQQADQALAARFRAGTSAAELVPERAATMDEVVKQLWRSSLGGDEPQGCALLAVGGYGRGELHPGSDIDVLVLVDPEHRDALAPLLEAFIAGLWDLGLEVGHSVRSVDECIAAAADDITIATNLMESRQLCGTPDLGQALRQALTANRIWPSPAFFEAKLAEQQARHAKFHDTAYNLEPNIKSSPGGLRDIQMVGWVAKRHFGAEHLHERVAGGFLTEAEYQALHAGQCFLWDVRFGLHLIAGRREDRLLFDHQVGLAELFGYVDDDQTLAVEQFMQRYFRTAMDISRLNEMLLQHFQEAILYTSSGAEPTPINRRFQIRRDFLEVTDPSVFRRYPFALLEVFLILQQHPQLKGVRASTIRLIRQHRTLIDESFRRDLRCRSLFMEILRQPQGITHALRRMHRYGVLGRYIPAFGRISGRMQYDLFHVYTVDSHTLFVVRNLRRMALAEHRTELPLAHDIMQQLPKPELLFLAALFHDIAKGRGGDHSELGAGDAYEFCIQHGLGAYDARLVAWLVRHHLDMSVTAQRKDLSDPAVITDFARTMGDQLHLDYLYLLTVADIRATNPDLWNAWRAALLNELYVLARAAIRRGLSKPLDKRELIRDTQRDARRILRQRGYGPGRIRGVWRQLPEDYFLRHSAEEIAWHTEAIAETAPAQLPLVLAASQETGGGARIFLYAPDSRDLFARCVWALDRLGLSIQDARVITTDGGFTLDSYRVLEQHGAPPSEEQRLEEVRQALAAAAAEQGPPPAPVARHIPRQLQHFRTETQIHFTDDPDNHRTVVELITADRPGLLARVGKAFSGCGVRVKNAKIATMGERAEDVFFITDDQGQPLRLPVQYRCVREALYELLDEEATNA